jgi:hypothetical protein
MEVGWFGLDGRSLISLEKGQLSEVELDGLIVGIGDEGEVCTVGNRLHIMRDS